MVNKPYTLIDVRNTMAAILGALIGLNLVFWTIISIAAHNIKRSIQNRTL